MAFRNIDLLLSLQTGQGSQPSLSLDPFSMTDDLIKEKVYDTHITDDESYDVEALFNVVANIIKHSTKGAVPVELSKDKPLPDNHSLPFSKIKKIVHQVTSNPARELEHAHKTTMAILHELERSNWGTKAAVSLGAFAVEYGNLLHLTENQTTPAAKSLALLNGGLTLQDAERTRQAFAELNNVVEIILLVTEYIIELEKLSSIGHDQGNVPKVLEAIQEIPVDVYWIIITVVACFTHIGYLKGDSEYKLELLQFDQKLNSILRNLTVHVTKTRKEIGALQKADLFLTKTKKVHPSLLSLGQKWKNTFSYGIKGIDGTDLIDMFGSSPFTGDDTSPSAPSTDILLPLSRSSFPEGFIFGAATSAYQIEGAVNERGYSAWDHFTHTYPKKIKDGSNGDEACKSYELFKEDVLIMKDLKTDAYRFSLSWPRIIPTGKRSEGVKQEAIDYYNTLIDILLKNGLTPYVTLLHVNRPQALEDDYGGFLDRRMVDDFKDFVDLCFEKFGDRVKHWITLNEPYIYCYLGYTVGMMAPGRCSCWQKLDCLGGDSGTEPYQVGHNLLLAHSAAVQVYRTKYQESQKGVIGITLDSLWAVPYSSKKQDQEAALRAMDFALGWFMEPVTSGDYPAIMRELVEDRLPKFSEEESKQLRGSFDFIGINYYTSKFAMDDPVNHSPPSYITDTHVILTDKRHGIPIGEPTASGMYSYPKGLRELLCYIKRKYNSPLIYITENGVAQFNFPQYPIGVSLMDVQRLRYHNDHLYYVHSAIKDYDVNVKGYFVWSLLDNFEWSLGYTVRFGMNFVDFKDKMKLRYPKLSAQWFKLFLKN